jgi:hypothetical protein
MVQTPYQLSVPPPLENVTGLHEVPLPCRMTPSPTAHTFIALAPETERRFWVVTFVYGVHTGPPASPAPVSAWTSFATPSGATASRLTAVSAPPASPTLASPGGGAASSA